MWQTHLKHSFGIIDKCFARHPMDQQQAQKARKIIKLYAITWPQVESATIHILQETNHPHMQDQPNKVRKYFKPCE